MKTLLVFSIATILIALPSDAKSTDHPNPFCFFQNPMALGAGLSSGLDGKSPVQFLAEKYRRGDQLIQEAYAGSAGHVILGYPSFRKQLHKTSAVIALDLFYWDQVACGEPGWDERNQKAIDQLYALTVNRGIPLVIGNISRQSVFPKFKIHQPCAELINQRLKERCEAVPQKCLIIDMNQLSRKIEEHFAQKLSTLDARETNIYTRGKITRDGIHPRTEAGEVIAGAVESWMRESRLSCR